MSATAWLGELLQQQESLPPWARQANQAATYPRAFVEAAVTAGADRDALLALAQVPAERLDDPAGRLSLNDIRLIAAAARSLSQDPCLGFAAGNRMPLTAHGSLGYALMCAGTLREAMDILMRFWHLRGRGVQLIVSEQDDGLFMALMPELGGPEGLRNLMFSSMLTSMYRGVEFLMPEAQSITEIWLQGERPQGFERWQPLLPRVRFAMPRSGLALLGGTAVLARALPTANPEALSQALAQCQRDSLLLEEAEDVLRRSRAVLVLGAEGYPSPEQLAELLYLTPRTLRRRLQEQGYSYQQLLEEARRRDSCQLLAEPELEIQRIGESLGYSNPANFSRAFKSWTGLSPREWRQQHLG